MAIDLRANTAVDVLIGPFIDDGDGKTAETGLTITQADVRLSKNAQNMAQKNDANAAAHDEIGYHNCPLNTTDTDTEGSLVLAVHESGALPVRHEYNIMAEAAWDSLYVAKDDGFMDVNIKTIGRADTTETEATNLEAACAAYSVTRGLTGTAVPAAVADAAGGLMISDDGGWDADELYDAIVTDATGANIAVDIIAVKAETALIVADTNELQTDNIPGLIATAQTDLDTITGTAGALIATDAMDRSGTLDVNTKTTDATALDAVLKTSTFALAMADAIWDEVLTGATHNVAASAGRRLRSVGEVTSSTVNDAGASTTVFITALTETTTNHYNEQLVYFTDGALEGQVGVIFDYNGGTKTITLDEALTEAPGNGDAFDIIPTHVHTKSHIASAVWDDLTASHVAASTFGKAVADILALLDNARTEPGDTAPPVNPDAMTKIDYLYKFLRNKISTSATRIDVFDDAGTNIDHSSTISDDGTDFVRGEFGAGA